ncbi:MAG: hypothetical protein KA354_19530 [Phycisphaerae bacterium]|nr:hypothetical protein [Phycisphaerae bacterium]
MTGQIQSRQKLRPRNPFLAIELDQSGLLHSLVQIPKLPGQALFKIRLDASLPGTPD